MSLTQIKGRAVDVHLWTREADLEESARRQLENIAALPWAFHHVAVMPDVHYGKGATVGSVIAMKDAIAPAAVGVDIGCGMAAVKTNLSARDLPDDLKRVRSALEAAVPVGFDQHREPTPQALASPLWPEFESLDGSVQSLLGKAMRQLGSLGGGNHFIELCLDTAG